MRRLSELKRRIWALEAVRGFRHLCDKNDVDNIIDEVAADINAAIEGHLEDLIKFWKSSSVPEHLEKFRDQYVDAYKCVLHNHKDHDVFKVKKWLGAQR